VFDARLGADDIMETEDGALLAVLDVDHGELRVLSTPDGAGWLSIQTGNPGVDSGRIISFGSRAVIAYYNHHGSGAQLLSVDLSTRTVVWRAVISHGPAGEFSLYSNELELSRYADLLMVHGVEGGGEYLALFDPRTGARRLLEESWK
jgi:hypothetical protein